MAALLQARCRGSGGDYSGNERWRAIQGSTKGRDAMLKRLQAGLYARQALLRADADAAQVPLAGM